MTNPDKLIAALLAAALGPPEDFDAVKTLIEAVIPLAKSLLERGEALEDTNCRRVEDSNFTAAVCSSPLQGTGPGDLRGPLPLKDWCPRCAALAAEELTKALAGGSG